MKHSKGLPCRTQNVLHPVSRTAHKHARQKDRKTTGPACVCEAKAQLGQRKQAE